MGPDSALNFARWLGRLGFKTQNQPPWHQTVQPVALVGDHQHLVSPALEPSGVVGGFVAAVLLEGSAFLFRSFVPTWLDVLPFSLTQANLVIEIGQQGTPPPVLTAPVPLVPQFFESRGSVLIAEAGTRPPAVALNVPYVRAANSLLLPRIFLPAGGWVCLTKDVANQATGLAAWFHELPNDQGQ